MNRAPLLALMLAFVVESPMPAAPREAAVAIRTYNYARVSGEPLASARATADAIFEDAGISLEWIDCRVPQSAFGAPCTEPLNEGRDLLLRLTDRPSHDSATARIFALGTSMLDHGRGRGALMTVELFPIRAIAHTAITDVPTLLGRTIAHEIGHLLLGTSAHPKRGLMRALWSQNDLRGAKPAEWQFSAREATQMRHGLALRARAAN